MASTTIQPGSLTWRHSNKATPLQLLNQNNVPEIKNPFYENNSLKRLGFLWLSTVQLSTFDDFRIKVFK